MDNDCRGVLEAEIAEFMGRDNKAFVSGIRDDLDQLVHLEEPRAHLTIEGTRHREDGSIIESIDSFYTRHKCDGERKVSVLSGIRGARA